MNRLEDAGNQLASGWRSMKKRPLLMLGVVFLLTLLLFSKSLVESLGSGVGARLLPSDDVDLSVNTSNNDEVTLPARRLQPSEVVRSLREAGGEQASHLFDERFSGRALRLTLTITSGSSGMVGDVMGGLTLTGRTADGIVVEVQIDEKNRELFESANEFGPEVLVEGSLVDFALNEDGGDGESPVLFLEGGSFPALSQSEQ